MRIGINAQLLSFSQNYRNSGISQSILSLLTALASQPGGHEYIIFVNGEDTVKRLGGLFPKDAYVIAPWRESRPISRICWEQLALPSILRKHRIDLLHSPVNVLPAMLPKNCASVITLHDLAFLRLPKVLTQAKRIYHRIFTVRSLRQATLIIAVSESTKQEAGKLVGIPDDRIQTIYPCIDERFRPTGTDEEIQTFRREKGLTEGFVLYLGTLEPRKNITTLVEAYARLHGEYGMREKLVLAGGRGWYYEEIFRCIQKSGLESEVIFPGYVANVERALWYGAASAFVYPSLYEGFGLPVAEALACGVPVVTSNVSSLPEAGAGIALCVAPGDRVALADAMYKALTDTQFRRRSRKLGPLTAEKFSRKRMAEKTVCLYEKAVMQRLSG